jgi:hypothetical protein
MVVEEEIDGTMGLVIAEWPSGGQAAPRFRDKGEFELALAREELQKQVEDRRVPDAEEIPNQVVDDLRSRRISVGDVFAIKPSQEVDFSDDPEALNTSAWMEEVLDITAEAREAAKVKMYEALTPPLDSELEKHLIAESEESSQTEEPAR